MDLEGLFEIDPTLPLAKAAKMLSIDKTMNLYYCMYTIELKQSLSGSTCENKGTVLVRYGNIDQLQTASPLLQEE